MKVNPLFDRVLLLPEGDQYKKTASGILLGASSSELPILAKVIAVGNGKVEAGASRIKINMTEEQEANSVKEVYHHEIGLDYVDQLVNYYYYYLYWKY